MSREQTYTAIILKKQPYKEGDEIITLFTKQAGKIRCLAKGVKKPLSKLQQKLQTLFLVEVTLAGGEMPKIIHVEPVKVFAKMRENLGASRLAFYALELVLKFTADEQKNEQLFNLLESFLEFLDSGNQGEVLSVGLAKFKIGMLETSGVGINLPITHGTTDREDKVSRVTLDTKIFFSSHKGGFSVESFAHAMPVASGTWQLFLNLKSSSFENLKNLRKNGENTELQNLLSQFIEYQLERKIKSEKYL